MFPVTTETKTLRPSRAVYAVLLLLLVAGTNIPLAMLAVSDVGDGWVRLVSAILGAGFDVLAVRYWLAGIVLEDHRVIVRGILSSTSIRRDQIERIDDDLGIVWRRDGMPYHAHTWSGVFLALSSRRETFDLRMKRWALTELRSWLSEPS